MSERGLVGRSIDELVARATPAVLDMIDLDAVVQSLDINAIADELDLDALMERIDLDALVDRLDINAIAERIDMDELIDQIDIAPLVGRGSSEVAEGGVDLIRQQIIRFDVLLQALVDRVANRKPGEVPLGPGLGSLASDEAATEEAGGADDE